MTNPRIHLLPLLALSLAACGGSDGGRELTFEERVAADDRLQVVLSPCSEGRAFQQDTSDMTRVLADKLVFGQLDPLRHAKQELGRIGEPAMEDLTRVFDAAFSDNFRQGIVTNVLDVCALMDGPWGLDLARRALDHPSNSVRLNAYHVFSKHGTSESYEDVALFLPITPPGLRDDIVETMVDLDPVRVARELAGWIRDGDYIDLWKHTVPLVLAHAEEDVAFEIWQARDSLDLESEPFANAMMARHGHLLALQELRANLVDDLNGKRQLALTALRNAGLQREAYVVLEQDTVGKMRYAAVEILGELEPSEEVDGWLEQALNDVNEDVRVCALGHLLPRGNARAEAETLLLLQGSVRDRENAVRILRGSFASNPGLAEKALDVLVRIFEERGGLAGNERIGILQALATVPLEEATEYLMDACDSEESEISGMPGHRWAAIQAYNGGPTGVAVLQRRLPQETDLFRRLDLLHSIWQAEDDAARELLLALVEDPETSAYEVLYVAEKLMRMGPSEVVAPRIKRVYLARQDKLARKGLQCLLWSWYG